MMKLRDPFSLMVATLGLTSMSYADCYTTNCTGADITGRRGCYLCCAEHCVGDGELNCQESCDGAWIVQVGDFFPIGLLNELIATRGNLDAQMSFFMDQDLWDMWTADEEINIAVIELTDWLYMNAADIKVQKMALVTLSWLGTDYPLSIQGKQLIQTIFHDGLHSLEWNVRVSALLGIRDTQGYVNNPTIQADIVRMAAEDPNATARSTAFKVLELITADD